VKSAAEAYSAAKVKVRDRVIEVGSCVCALCSHVLRVRSSVFEQMKTMVASANEKATAAMAEVAAAQADKAVAEREATAAAAAQQAAHAEKVAAVASAEAQILDALARAAISEGRLAAARIQASRRKRDRVQRWVTRHVLRRSGPPASAQAVAQKRRQRKARLLKA
jgi:hypothetical protein